MCRYIAKLDQFKYLLSAENEEGWNATLYAAKTGDTNVLQFLWEEKVSFDHTSSSKRNALHVASDNGNLTACKLIVDLRPSLAKNADEKGRHAGHFAARNGNIEILMFLQTKIDVAEVTRDKMNILHMACLHNHIEMCRYILQSYPDLNVKITDKGWTTAHFVAGRGNNKGNEKEIFKVLLNATKKVDITLLTKQGNSVLTLAIKYNDHDFAEYLLQNHRELLNIPNVNDPRNTGNDDIRMISILDRFSV